MQQHAASASAEPARDIISVAAGIYITNELLITRACARAPGQHGAAGRSAPSVISVGANITSGVTISNLRVFSGSLTSGSGFGAGVASNSGSPLTLQNVDVLSNSNKVNSGGGIFAADVLTLTNVNVVGNSDPGGAGGGLRALGQRRHQWRALRAQQFFQSGRRAAG